MAFADNSKVSYIGESAFQSCTSLAAFNFPASVAYIGAHAFDNCSSLTAITFEDGETQLVIGEKDELYEDGEEGEGVKLPKYNYTFRYTALTEVTLPTRLEYLGGATFYGLTSLEKVTFPAADSELTAIGSSAFSGVNNAVFENIDKLTKLTLISNGAFNNVTSLHEITLHDSVTMIGKDAFASSGLTSIDVPANVKYIGDRAFGYATELESFVWESDGVSEYKLGTSVFEVYAYNGTTKLSNVVLPEGLVELPDGASNSGTFSYTSALTSIVLPSTLKKIGAYSFYKGGLTALDLSNSSVETIGDYAYAETKSLTTVELEGSPVNTIGAFAFAGSAITSFTISSELSAIGGSAFDTPVTLSVSRYNYYYRQEGAMIFENATNQLIYLDKEKIDGKFTFPEGTTEVGEAFLKDCTALTEVVLPDSVTKIGNNAFNGCTNLTAINFPANLESIGDGAFQGTKIASAVIGRKVSRIGNNAFKDIKELVSLEFELGGTVGLSMGTYAFSGSGIAGTLVIPNRTRNVDFDTIGIDNYCFAYCASLENLVVESGTPAGLEDRPLSIGRFAFMDCVSLVSVTLSEIVGTEAKPNSLPSSNYVFRKALDFEAFAGCTNLTTFTYERSDYNATIGTAGGSNFDGVLIGNYQFYKCTNLTTVVLPDTMVVYDNKSKQYTNGDSAKYIYANGSKKSTSNCMKGAGREIFNGCEKLEYVTMGTADVGGLFSSCTSTLKALVINGVDGMLASTLKFGAQTGIFFSKEVKEVTSLPSGVICYTDATIKPEGWSDTVWSGLTTGTSLSQFFEIVNTPASSESGEEAQA